MRALIPTQSPSPTSIASSFTVYRIEPASMVQNHHAPVATITACEGHSSLCGRTRRRTRMRHEVQTRCATKRLVYLLRIDSVVSRSVSISRISPLIPGLRIFIWFFSAVSILDGASLPRFHMPSPID